MPISIGAIVVVIVIAVNHGYIHLNRQQRRLLYKLHHLALQSFTPRCFQDLIHHMLIGYCYMTDILQSLAHTNGIAIYDVIGLGLQR